MPSPMAEDDTNPYRVGTEVDSSITAKPTVGNGLGYFCIAVFVFAIGVAVSRYVPPNPGTFLNSLTAVASLILAAVGFYKSLTEWERIATRDKAASFLNFVSFNLNMMWSLWILYALLFSSRF